MSYIIGDCDSNHTSKLKISPMYSTRWLSKIHSKIDDRRVLYSVDEILRRKLGRGLKIYANKMFHLYVCIHTCDG
jgi:hypothetical protein